MKKVSALFISVVFLLALAASPAIAAGGKVQGDQAISDNFGGASSQTPNNEEAEDKANLGPDKEGNQV